VPLISTLTIRRILYSSVLAHLVNFTLVYILYLIINNVMVIFYTKKSQIFKYGFVETRQKVFLETGTGELFMDTRP